MKKVSSIILIALFAFASITLVTLSVAQATTPQFQKTVTVYVKAEIGGTVTYSPIGTGTGTVKAGTTSQFTVPVGTKTITFTANPQSGYKFAFWSGAGQVGNTHPTLTISVGNGIGSSCQPLTAVFTPKFCTPEYSSLGALAALGACFAALLVYKRKSFPSLNLNIHR